MPLKGSRSRREQGAPTTGSARRCPSRAATGSPPTRGPTCGHTAPRARIRRSGCGGPLCRGPSPQPALGRVPPSRPEPLQPGPRKGSRSGARRARCVSLSRARGCRRLRGAGPGAAGHAAGRAAMLCIGVVFRRLLRAVRQLIQPQPSVARRRVALPLHQAAQPRTTVGGSAAAPPRARPPAPPCRRPARDIEIGAGGSNVPARARATVIKG